MDDFVTPEPVRIPLRGGQWVDIAKSLNHGETEDMFERMSPHGILANRRWVRTAQILAYVLGWSLTRNGQPVPIGPTGGEIPEQTRIDTIRGLSPDRAIEIYDAIEAHEAAQAVVLAEQKKILSGAPAVVATSSSPSAADGPSDRSAS
jgi:hypothetical protein